METIERIKRETLAVLRPPADQPLVDWIESNIVLPSTASATPGKMRLYAYQKGICDALDDPSLNEIVIRKSARIGFTALLGAYIGHCVAVNPAPLLVTQPTTDDSRAFSVDTEALFEASPSLRGLISDGADETGRSTMMRRIYPGGTLEFLSASSPRAFRRKLGKTAIADEIDAYPPSGEGSILDLLRMRTQTYRDRKLIYGGTPIFDHGEVSRLYAESDQRVFEVKCVECHDFAEIQWKDLQWRDGDPESVKWCCPNCGCLIDERHKVEMVENGRWTATNPDHKRAGFKINSLISPHYNARWSALVAEFLEAKKHPETLQTFTNLVLGEPWRTEDESLDEHELFQRREAFSLDNLPESVLWLTAGVDCQDDRLEAVICGYDADGGIYVLDHRVFWGPIDGDAVWLDLDDLLKSKWQHPLGGQIGISTCAVDSSDGDHVDLVNAFTAPRYGKRIVSIKGVSGFTRAPLQRSKNKSKLFLIGVDAVKKALFMRISRNSGIRFSETLEPVYFEMLTSERQVVRYSAGKPQMRFERIPGKRAESLDATGYSVAVFGLITQSAENRQAELSSRTAPPKPKTTYRSKWLDR